GSSSAARMAMMAMTTSNSMSVKAFFPVDSLNFISISCFNLLQFADSAMQSQLRLAQQEELGRLAGTHGNIVGERSRAAQRPGCVGGPGRQRRQEVCRRQQCVAG